MNFDRKNTNKGKEHHEKYVFLKAQNTLKYCKGHQKQGFRTMNARTGEVQKNMKKYVKIHPEFDAKSVVKSCSKK